MIVSIVGGDRGQRLVLHGFLPEGEVMTGVGTVPAQVPGVRDRGFHADGSKIKFRSALVPPYLRTAKSVEKLLPWLYQKGISTGDFNEALAARLGPNAEGLSSSTATRLKAAWWDEYEAWRKRDLKGRDAWVFQTSGNSSATSPAALGKSLDICFAFRSRCRRSADWAWRTARGPADR